MWDVVVCEDFASLRESLTEFLAESGQWVVRAASDGRALRQLFVERVPDVVLLDVGLPDESGVALAQWVRTTYPDVGVVMLTGRFSPRDRIAGWRAGVDMYLGKPAEVEEVELALKAVLARSRRHEALEDVGDGHSLLVTRAVVRSDSGDMAGLTGRETMALQMLAQSPGTVVQIDALVSLLWPDQDDIDYQNALFSLIRRLRRKLESVGLPADAISVVRGRGYRFNAKLRIVLAAE